MVISLPKIPCIHHVIFFLANPMSVVCGCGCVDVGVNVGVGVFVCLLQSVQVWVRA